MQHAEDDKKQNLVSKPKPSPSSAIRYNTHHKSLQVQTGVLVLE